MVMGVMTRVLGSHTGFVLAIACHCCPTELQGQQNQQKNRQVPSHSLNFSDSNFSKSPGIYLSPWRLRSIKKDSDALASAPIYVYSIRLFIVCKLTIICGWPLLAESSPSLWMHQLTPLRKNAQPTGMNFSDRLDRSSGSSTHAASWN